MALHFGTVLVVNPDVQGTGFQFFSCCTVWDLV